eukprot:3393609-Pyramimonas_sp.AAC.1
MAASCCPVGCVNPIMHLSTDSLVSSFPASTVSAARLAASAMVAYSTMRLRVSSWYRFCCTGSLGGGSM